MKALKKLINPVIIIIFLTAIPAAAGFYYYSVMYKTDISIVPNSGAYQIFPYNDVFFHGESEILGFGVNKNSIKLEYLLKKNKTFPYMGYSGIMILPAQTGIHIENSLIRFDRIQLKDLSGYDYMQVDVENSGSGSIQFIFWNFDKRITKTNDLLSYDYISHECILYPGNKAYLIPLKDFQVQTWWLSLHSIRENVPSYNDLSHVACLQIQTGYRTPVGRRAGFTVKGLAIGQDHSLLFLRIFIGLVLYSIIAIVIFLLVRRKKISILTVPYEKVSAQNNSDIEKDRIIQYFAKSYSNPNLSLSGMAKDLGIHYARIGNIMKRHFNLGFRQYLNLVRISETKRLLSATDLGITRIALEVGFNNVTHFNRIFKIIERITPKEYRRKFYDGPK